MQFSKKREKKKMRIQFCNSHFMHIVIFAWRVWPSMGPHSA